MTLTELIQRAVDIAMTGIDDLGQRTRLETTVEPLLPVVFGKVGDELAAGEHTRSLLRRTRNVTLANGAATLPGDVLTVYICDSVLYDPADLTKRYSLVSWDEMVKESLDTRLGHYAVEGESILHVVEPGEAFEAAGGADIALKLSIAHAPTVPATAAAQVDVNDEVIDILLERLAMALKPTIVAKR